MNTIVNQFVDSLPPGTPQLGSIVWYTVRDTLIPHGHVQTEMVRLGLGPIPPVPQDRKVFQRVTGPGRNRRSVPVASSAGVVTARRNYMVRRSESTKLIVATVVAETISLNSNDTVDFDYEPTATITWHAATPRTLDIDLAKADTTIREIVHEIEKDYADEVGKLNSYAIREWMRAFLGGDCDATIVRPSGGVYFVSQQYTDRLATLSRFTTALNTIAGSDITLEALPLIDTARQRTLVKEAFKDESIGVLNHVLEEIMQIGSGTVKERRRERILQDYTAVLDRVKTYRKLLDDNLGELDSTLKIVQSGIAKLVVG